MTSYNTGTTAQQAGVAQSTHPTLTVPAGIQPGDTMLVIVGMFTFTPTLTGITCTASSGHAWTQLGTVGNSAAVSGLNQFGVAFTRVATAGDAGDTLTFAWQGTPGATNQDWWTIDLASWSGGGGIDVVAQSSSPTTAGANTAPSTSTAESGEWLVGACTCAVASGGSFGSPETHFPTGVTTQRQNATNSGISTIIADSNGAVANGSIGGGSWGTTNGTGGGSTDQWITWTFAIAPGVLAMPAGQSQPGGRAWRRRHRRRQVEQTVIATPNVTATAGVAAAQASAPGPAFPVNAQAGVAAAAASAPAATGNGSTAPPLAYNTGATGTASGSASATVTVPAGVSTSPADTLLIGFCCFTEDSSQPSFAITGGSGGSWTLLSPTDASANPQLSAAAGIFSYAAVYARPAASGDPGAALTITETGSPAGTTWWAVALVAYAGADVSVADVFGSAELTGQTSATINTPAETTSADGDWAVWFYLGGVGLGNTVTLSTGTQRQAVTSGDGIAAAVYDSAGSVGPAGTSITAKTFTDSGSAAGCWPVAFTVGLKSASGPATSASAGVAAAQAAANAATGFGGQGGTPPAAAAQASAVQPTTAVSAHAGVAAASASAGGMTGASSLTMKLASTNGTTHVESWTSNTPMNSGGNHVLRILRPQSPAADRPHVFLWCLPVGVEGDNTWGSALDLLQAAGYHDKWNATILEPTYGISPWYGDSDSDPTARLESATLAYVNWAIANLALTPYGPAIQGTEAHHLLGFSKSGVGGTGLLFRHPGLFGKAVIWDTPYDMAVASRFPPDAPANYGSDANFAANYYLSAGHIAAWDAMFTAAPRRPRIWVGGGVLYSSECSDFATLLTSAGVPFIDATSNTGDGSHEFATQWVLTGTDAILGAAGIPAATASAPPAKASVGAQAGVASASASASAPTVSTSSSGSAPAGVAAALASAPAAGHSAAASPPASPAAAAGAAAGPVPAAGAVAAERGSGRVGDRPGW